VTRCPLEAKIARVQYHLDETDRWVPISRGGQMAINRRRLRLINELDYLETLRTDRDWQLCYGGWYEYYKEQAKDSLTSE